MKLNISLYKDDVKRFEECLRPRTNKRQYDEIGNGQTAAGTAYRIYLASRQAKAPPWVEFIKKAVPSNALKGVENVIHAAIILLEVQTTTGRRFFGITHGHGHHLINKEKIELNFGLKTALNAVNTEQISLADIRNIGAQTVQRRVATNASATLRSLAFDFDTDLLRIIGGRCVDQKLGLRLEGSDSLHLTVKNLDFNVIGEKCASIYEVFRRDDYKDRFEFVDYVQPERSQAITDALDQQLVDALQARENNAKIALVSPDQIEQRHCVAYKIFGLTSAEQTYEELSLVHLYDYLQTGQNGRKLSRKQLKQVRLIGLNENDTITTDNDPLYAYLVFETEYQGRRYVLSNQKWYQVEAGYLASLERKLAGIRECNHPLRKWTKVPDKHGRLHYHETAYNQQYAVDRDYLVLDRNNFRRFGKKYGQSQVEVADLFHLPTKTLFCVKRLSESPTLSHLLAQGSVSAQLLGGMVDYRDEFMDQVQQRIGPVADAAKYITDIKFVYAIGSETRKSPLTDLLPVFSKVNMVKHAHAIRKEGFEVEIAWVPMV
ncbi:DUF6119 family protein [Polyangium aurulentum]|uniref:DUF6119 family protein n=1 Tax=Polyangium aurulentum TaxID=2567896 RepID=UPI00146EB017|nr:DUF6119 family protein [Polyangium aurulentum]UQA63262.1 TIGR04141 family sporadically distributed protein [Polyangium aurulentum]